MPPDKISPLQKNWIDATVTACRLQLISERHVPYGITQCYLPPDTGERALP